MVTDLLNKACENGRKMILKNEFFDQFYVEDLNPFLFMLYIYFKIVLTDRGLRWLGVSHFNFQRVKPGAVNGKKLKCFIQL